MGDGDVSPSALRGSRRGCFNPAVPDPVGPGTAITRLTYRGSAMADITRTFSQVSLRGFLAALASADAPQDGVTAAGIAAGMGTSLLLFIATLQKTRSDSLEDRMALAAAAGALGDIQAQLLEAVDTDTAVKMFAARRMPHGTEREHSAREAAIQLALRAAADVPLEVMRLSTQAL